MVIIYYIPLSKITLLEIVLVRRAPGDSGEFLGEEIFQERRFS